MSTSLVPFVCQLVSGLAKRASLLAATLDRAEQALL